jgi:hypothetical protein
MRWDTRFWKPVRLKDGRTISALGQARELIRSHRQFEGDPEWQVASELLARASEATSLIDDALGKC